MPVVDVWTERGSVALSHVMVVMMMMMIDHHPTTDLRAVVVVLAVVLDEGPAVHVADEGAALDPEEVEAAHGLLEGQAHLTRKEGAHRWRVMCVTTRHKGACGERR